MTLCLTKDNDSNDLVYLINISLILYQFIPIFQTYSKAQRIFIHFKAWCFCGGKYRQKRKKNYFCGGKYFVRRLCWL